MTIKTICDVRKQKNDVRNTPPETIRNEKNSVTKKEQNSKNADCGFTGRFAKRFSGERPDPLGFELTFPKVLFSCFTGAWSRSFAPRLLYQAPATVPFRKIAIVKALILIQKYVIMIMLHISILCLGSAFGKNLLSP